jgi:sugar/nucleoside kinase (ribokinase family)
VGVGGVGIDYLASVAMFPKPDQKLRTETLDIQGGGNCGNAMTGVARLGLQSRILSTVGTDSPGDAVVAEFQADGVSTEFLQRQEGAATPFTYIIVDEAGVCSPICAVSSLNVLLMQMHVRCARLPCPPPSTLLVLQTLVVHEAI